MPVEINELKTIINQYGMPILAAGGMGYFIYFIWKFVTTTINPELSEAKKTIIALIDRIRMLDNDMIRLEQKLQTAIEMQRTIANAKQNENTNPQIPTPPAPPQQPPAGN